MFEWEYSFLSTRYLWSLLSRIFSIVYSFFSSGSKWNVFYIDVLKSVDFNSDILNTEKILILLNKSSSYVLNLLTSLMKNKPTFTWFNFLLDFFVLRFFISKYTLFLFFSRDAIFCFLLTYLKKCCCVLIILFCTVCNVFICFSAASINIFDCLKLSRFDSRSKFV